MTDDRREIDEEWVSRVATWLLWGDPEEELPYCTAHRTWHWCEFTLSDNHGKVTLPR